MALARRVAVTLPEGPDIRRTIARLEWAEANGYPDAWFGDSGAPDTITQVAAVARHTSSIRIGIGATPVYTRSPAVIAASVNALGQLLPGRFVMGIGSSSQTIMGRWNGIPLDKPLTRVRETAELVRSMLTGAKSDFSGVTVRSHRLSAAAARKPAAHLHSCPAPEDAGDGRRGRRRGDPEPVAEERACPG